MTEDTNFQKMAEQFNGNISDGDIHTRSPDYIKSQYDVTEEEIEEFKEAFEDGGREEVAEEMADVLVTLFVLADRMHIDLEEAYRMKMDYNLQKSGERDENGKVVDDLDIEKPDFSEVV